MARRHAPFGSRYIEDPSIAQCAAVEYERLWNRIGHRVQYGGYFFAAREQILTEEIPDIARAFGKVVASRVTAAIERTPYASLPKPALDAVRAETVKCHEQYLIRTRGKVSWIQRWSLRVFGERLW